MSTKREGWSAQGRDGLPSSLNQATSPRQPFEHARDPYLKNYQAHMQKSEKERRDSVGNGSLMVQMDKPFPELKPSNQNAKGALRQSFNQRWEAEISRAQKQHSEQQQSSAQTGKDPFAGIDTKRDPFEQKSTDFPKRQLGR